jgi:hypothetical protein
MRAGVVQGKFMHPVTQHEDSLQLIQREDRTAASTAMVAHQESVEGERRGLGKAGVASRR